MVDFSKMGDTSYADSVLSNFPPSIRQNIEELCLGPRIGLSAITLNDISIMKNGSATLDNYHFTIKVPYAGKKLKWEVIFDPEDFYFTPDFYFNDETFLDNPQLSFLLNNVPSLETWDLRNPRALTNILAEFLCLYKKLQVEKLRSENMYSAQWEEYRVLTEENKIDPANIEVYVGKQVDLLISLDVDCSGLPPFVQPLSSSYREEYNPGDDFALLKITLEPDSNRSSGSMQLSPRLGQNLFGKNSTLPSLQNKSLTAYVELMEHMLKCHIKSIADNYAKRKIFVVNLVALCNKNIVEYDVVTFKKAIFLFEEEDYNCMVTVSLGPTFPHDPPVVQLSSIYCQEWKFCNETLDKYPYKMTHKAEVNCEHLVEYLGDAVKKFKCHRHNRW